MNICIDGFGVTHLKGTGHYTYTKNLIEGLLDDYPQPKYSLVWQAESRLEGRHAKQNLDYVNLKLDRKQNDLRLLEEYIKEKKVALFHSPNNGFSLPQRKACKYIMTVHDAAAKTCPVLVDEKYKSKFEQVFDHACKNADKIIAVSQHIKWELENYFNIASEKIEVVYPWFHKPPDTEVSYSREHLLKKYNIYKNYILSIGSIHSRKNLSTLITAFKASKLDREGFQLIVAGSIVGKRQRHYRELRALADSLGIADSVIFLGRVEQVDVPHLYQCASCMVNLSDYEGFPQTCLEAISYGTPVICGTHRAFREVMEQAALYVNTKDIMQVKDILRGVVLDGKMLGRGEAISQSEKFCKEDSIKRMVSIYENVVYE